MSGALTESKAGMKHSIEDIDTAIAQKRQELKDLIQDEIDDLVSTRYHLSAPTITLAEATRLATRGVISEADAVKARQPAVKPKPVAPANRLASIAKAAKRMTKTAKRYTPEQKFAILDEYEYAPVKQAVLSKHGVSAQSVSTWKTQVAAGRLVRGVG